MADSNTAHIATDETPEELNFLPGHIFKFTVKKLPTVTFNIQTINLPGIAFGPTQQETPFVKMPIPGDHLIYDNLQITYRVDEDLTNYKEIHDWIKALGYPDNFPQVANLLAQEKTTGNGEYSDMSLIISNSSRIPTSEIHFKDAFPISISSLIFNTTLTDVDYLEASATFVYRSFDINVI
jgi:hypothetical protein